MHQHGCMHEQLGLVNPCSGKSLLCHSQFSLPVTIFTCLVVLFKGAACVMEARRHA